MPAGGRWDLTGRFKGLPFEICDIVRPSVYCSELQFALQRQEMQIYINQVLFLLSDKHDCMDIVCTVLVFDTATCFGCTLQPSSGRVLFHKQKRIIFIKCNWVVTRWQWLFYMYTNVMKKVTRKFKSGGLHERHVVATWKLGNHLSIRLQTQGKQDKPVSRWPVAGPSGY